MNYEFIGSNQRCSKRVPLSTFLFDFVINEIICYNETAPWCGVMDCIFFMIERALQGSLYQAEDSVITGRLLDREA